MVKIRTNDELWARIETLITVLRQRREQDLANQVENALRSNTGLTDGWHLLLMVSSPPGQPVKLASRPKNGAERMKIVNARWPALG